jgi:hypothetical protein
LCITIQNHIILEIKQKYENISLEKMGIVILKKNCPLIYVVIKINKVIEKNKYKDK